MSLPAQHSIYKIPPLWSVMDAILTALLAFLRTTFAISVLTSLYFLRTFVILLVLLGTTTIVLQILA